ncbi:hypothetical protein CLOSTASPAR_04298 [[Clostridium] asparagiforme DSM 15981]|uniref:Uncharacterized protein n=1 Tax=[Clostridium] asparagiforme DSM 15981 TaxID=518636 RepID=C0D4V3_9FIRM|nr:hypothetical protein CLOSTASPAR_04298 [[Clostridium] asparagiforme DSM 15981]
MAFLSIFIPFQTAIAGPQTLVLPVRAGISPLNVLIHILSSTMG